MSNTARKLDNRQAPSTRASQQSKRPSLLRVKQPMAITAKGIHKSYRTGNIQVPVLRGVDIAVAEGEFVAIVGQSGSGKSTLLHLLGTLDKPDKGEISIGQHVVNSMKSTARDRLRNRQIGLIFQFYHLLPELTALENVMIPQMINDGLFQYFRGKKKYQQRAKELLEKVGLEHRAGHRPSQMSGGEMQRTAIARALMSRPNLLLADEPTGNLDRKNGDEVMQTLMTLRDQENLTIVMVTHDDAIAAKANRTIKLVEGRVAI